jgi:hypothetical protein
VAGRALSVARSMTLSVMSLSTVVGVVVGSPVVVTHAWPGVAQEPVRPVDGHLCDFQWKEECSHLCVTLI